MQHRVSHENPSEYRDDVTVRSEVHDRIMSIVIDRPEKRNAVDLATLKEIAIAQSTARSSGVRVVVLSGAPPAFCSGADLSGVELGEFTDTLLTVLKGFGSLDAITIAAVDGPALGAGTQLAAACDLRVATPDSRFGVPAAKLGLAVDRWTVERVVQEVGWSAARYMLLTGESVRAESLVGGFVHRVGAVADALAWAVELAQLAPFTIRAHKSMLEGVSSAPARDISDSDMEALRLAAWNSNDATEGRRAFAEKRPPRFDGR